MRQHLFKAKHIHAFSSNQDFDGRWIEGYLSDENYINSPELEGEFLIDPETICECTGVPDKNKTLIFEGDIVSRKLLGDSYITGVVVWFDIGFCGFHLKCGNRFYPMGRGGDNGIVDDEVIGNIFDNPELIKEA